MQDSRGNAGDQISSDDISRLNKAMKDNKFRGFIQEYWDEMTADGTREEYDKYLEQLEDKGELPPGCELLRSDPGCCVKTHMRFKNGQVQKLFINIAQSDLIEDIGYVKDKDGQRVSMPYSLGPPRPDKTKKGENCMTCDVAVGTRTFSDVEKKPHVLKMVVDTCTAALQKQFLKDHEEVMKDFTMMKNTKCKGGTPYLMSVQTTMLKAGKRKKKKKKTTTDEDGMTPGELRKWKKEADDKRKAEEQQSEEEEELSAVESEEEEVLRVRVPKHKLIHQGVVNIGNFVESITGPVHSSNIVHREIPRNLRLVVELPTVSSASEIDTEITIDNVMVEVLNKFYLDLPLPYKINPDKGTAKFDKRNKPPILTFVLPVTEENLKLEPVKVGRLHDDDNLEEYEADEDELESEHDGKETITKEAGDRAIRPTPGSSLCTETAPSTDVASAFTDTMVSTSNPAVAGPAIPEAELVPAAPAPDTGPRARDLLDGQHSLWMDLSVPSLEGDAVGAVEDDADEDMPSLIDAPHVTVVDSVDALEKNDEDATNVNHENNVEEAEEIITEERDGRAPQVAETRDSVILAFSFDAPVATVEMAVFDDIKVQVRCVGGGIAWVSQCILHRVVLPQWHYEFHGDEVWVIIRKLDPEPWCRILAEGPQEFTIPGAGVAFLDEAEDTEAVDVPKTIEAPKGSDATMGQGVLLRNRLFFELF